MKEFWTLMHPLHDIDDVVKLGEELLELEGSVLKTDSAAFRQYLTVAATNQLFDKSREFLAVARDSSDKLLGYCIFDRGGYATYSREEISNAKFHHLLITLPLKQRVRLINDMLNQHILWAMKYNIPVICSTSIRSEYDGFMRIHKKRGFIVNGSYAFIRTENATIN